jgi:hypothetical protein
MRKNNDPPGSSPKRHRPSHFNSFAPILAENGFTVIPTNGKNPVTKNWHNPRPTDGGWLAKMIQRNRFVDCNVGIVCGRVIGIDIDADQPEEANRLQTLVFEHLGETKFVRVGRAPRRLLLYGALDAIASTKVGCIDVLSGGRQFVAYGIHPDTGQNYQWADSHYSPSTASINLVPTTSAEAVFNFIAACTGQGRPTHLPTDSTSACEPATKSRARTGQRRRFLSENCYDDRIVLDDRGLVVDGREAFLAKLTAAGYARRDFNTPDDLAKAVWAKFSTEADLSRPKGSNPRSRWSHRDALAKARLISRRKPELKSPRRPVGRHPTSGLQTWRRSGFWTVEKREQHVAEVARCLNTPSVLAVARAMIETVDFDTGFCTLTIAGIASRCNCSITAVKNARSKLNTTGFWISIRGVYVPILSRQLESGQVPPSKREKASAGHPEACANPEAYESQLTKKKQKKPAAGHPNVASMYRLVPVPGGSDRVVGGGASIERQAPASAPSAPKSPSGSVATSSARPPYQPDLFGGQGVDLDSYGRGRLSPDLVHAIRQECRALGMSQGDLARQIGLSRPQLANALAGRVGVSAEPAARLLDWLRETIVNNLGGERSTRG